MIYVVIYIFMYTGKLLQFVEVSAAAGVNVGNEGSPGVAPRHSTRMAGRWPCLPPRIRPTFALTGVHVHAHTWKTGWFAPTPPFFASHIPQRTGTSLRAAKFGL